MWQKCAWKQKLLLDIDLSSESSANRSVMYGNYIDTRGEGEVFIFLLEHQHAAWRNSLIDFFLKAFFYLNLCTSSAWHLIKSLSILWWPICRCSMQEQVLLVPNSTSCVSVVDGLVSKLCCIVHSMERHPTPWKHFFFCSFRKICWVCHFCHCFFAKVRNPSPQVTNTSVRTSQICCTNHQNVHFMLAM